MDRNIAEAGRQSKPANGIYQLVTDTWSITEGKARVLLGSLLEDTHDNCARVYRVLREAEDLRPADPDRVAEGRL